MVAGKGDKTRQFKWGQDLEIMWANSVRTVDIFQEVSCELNVFLL